MRDVYAVSSISYRKVRKNEYSHVGRKAIYHNNYVLEAQIEIIWLLVLVYRKLLDTSHEYLMIYLNIETSKIFSWFISWLAWDIMVTIIQQLYLEDNKY